MIAVVRKNDPMLNGRCYVPDEPPFDDGSYDLVTSGGKVREFASFTEAGVWVDAQREGDRWVIERA